VGKLRSWRHEKFCQEIVAGTDLKEAFVIAGFKPSSLASRNYNRLLRRPDVAGRIAELNKEKEDKARAAGMSAAAVLAVLKGYGIEQVEEFFDRDETGIVRVRDRQQIPVEASIALLRFLRESLGIKNGAP
jgi:phage terminase small subunit